MPSKRAPAWTLVVACTASMAGCARPITAVAYSIGGQERILTGEVAPEMPLRALADQASRDFGCPAADIRAQERVGLAVYTAEGCEKHGVYLVVVRRGVTEGAPGFQGKAVWLDRTRFALISEGEPRGAIDELARAAYPDDAPIGSGVSWSLPWHYVIPGQPFAYHGPEALRALRPWIALNVQGARDLSCPRGEVVVELRFGPRGVVTPIAEGCGRRAVYLSGSPGSRLDLASIVPVNRP